MMAAPPARRHHEKGRDLVDGVADGEEGSAPEDIERGEGGDEGEAGGRRREAGGADVHRNSLGIE